MKIGLIGFGEVNQTLTKQLKNKHEIYISTENRTINTINNIKKAKINILNKETELKNQCDIIINATTPKSALKIATKYSRNYNGLYLDLNNINPLTTEKINTLFKENFIKGAIIGNIKKSQLLLLSGEKTEKIKELFPFIPTKIVSKNPSDVSKLKLLRSTYTKGVTAILKETFEIANEFNLNKELWEILEVTENTENFKNNSLSRIKNSEKDRKTEELKEIINFLEYMNISDYNKIMINSTYSKFKKIN